MEDKIKSFNTPIDDNNLVLLFYWVAVSTNRNSFSGVTKDALNRLQKEIGFTTEFKDIAPLLKSHKNPNHLVMVRVDKSEAYIITLLRHFRNAFCHNNVKKNADGSYTLQDYWLDKETNKQKMTMFANIDADKLQTLLTELKKLKK